MRKTWIALMIGFVVFWGGIAMVSLGRAEAADYGEKQQQERIVRAEEEQARALKDIARSLDAVTMSLKKLERCTR